MMRKTKISIVASLIFTLWVLPGEVASQVYRYIDKDGVVHFTDTPTDNRFAPLHGMGIENNAGRDATEAEENKEIGREEEREKQQPLVPQGEFAVQLVDALKIGQVKDEAQAQNMLSAIGIEPTNGWIAGYSVTPVIIVEIKKKVARAADAGKLRVEKDQAMKAVGDIKAKFDQKLIKQPPRSGTSSSKPASVKVIGEKPTPSPRQNDSIKSPSPRRPNHPPTSSQSSVGRVHPEIPTESSHPDGSVKFPSTRRLYQPQGSYPSMERSEPYAVKPEAPEVPSRSDRSVKFPSTHEFYQR